MSDIYSNPNPEETDPAISRLKAALLGRGAGGTWLWFLLLTAAIIALTLVANRCGDDDNDAVSTTDSATAEAKPTETATPEPVATPEPTATPEPEPVATAAPAPIATTAPEQTATPQPTPASEATDVSVAIDDGTITLTGTVADDAQRGAMVSAAASLVSLENVVDELVTEADRTTDGGRVTLTGTVEEATGSLLVEAFSGLADGGIDDTGLELIASVDVVAELNELFALNPIQFASGSSTILAESEPVLDRVGATLNAAPGLNLDIVGHTDSTGDAGLNLQLSLDRAAAVQDYLVGQGVAADRLSADGRGDTEPIADNDTEAGRQENRRIEFEIAG